MKKRIFIISSGIIQIILGIFSFVILIWMVINKTQGTLPIAVAIIFVVFVSLGIRNLNNFFLIKSKESNGN